MLACLLVHELFILLRKASFSLSLKNKLYDSIKKILEKC